MLDFAGQQLVTCLGELFLADVASNNRRAHDFPCLVLHRRNGERDVNEARVLALANRLVVVNVLTTSDALENFRFLAVTISRKKDCEGLADHFLGGVAEEALRPKIPARDYTVEVLAQDRI